MFRRYSKIMRRALAVPADIGSLRPADPAQPRRSRAAGRRIDAAYRLGYRHCRRRGRAVETSRRASDRAALFAAGDRLQSPAGRAEFDPAHQRSDRHTRQRRHRCATPRRRGASDLRSLSSPHRRGDRRAACATASRRCWCRCTASRRSTPAIARPWHIGTLYHRDTRLPPLLLEVVARRARSRGRRQRALCGERRDRLHHSGARRGARPDEHRHRNPPGFDRRCRPASSNGRNGWRGFSARSKRCCARRLI